MTTGGASRRSVPTTAFFIGAEHDRKLGLANSMQPCCNDRRKLSNGGRERASVSISAPG
jgi:hypothetical protein